MTDMANSVSVKPAVLTPAVHIRQANSSQWLLTRWKPAHVHERPWDFTWVWDAWRQHVERDAAAGAIVPFGAQTRSARPLGTETPGGPCTCSWNPSRLWVPNGMRRCGLSCVVQLRAQTSWSRCPETVSNRVGFCTQQQFLHVSNAVDLDACGASLGFGEHWTGVQSARNDWCFATMSQETVAWKPNFRHVEQLGAVGYTMSECVEECATFFRTELEFGKTLTPAASVLYNTPVDGRTERSQVRVSMYMAIHVWLASPDQSALHVS